MRSKSSVWRLQDCAAVNQDLSIQVEKETKDPERMQGENKEIPILRAEIELVQSGIDRMVIALRRINTFYQLVVGTPSRVSDLLRTQNQALHSDHVRMFVLDEPDEMLSKGFDRQIHDFLQLLPGNVEVVALYPTMPEYALEIARKLMNKSVTMNLWQSIVFW
ncbi:Eukaryotic initiation factor 4A-3 [Capsicum baccatum]|uniref:Eukaryotic initiation factor 4A-3 n=1 Tax=Capsicum baccatum TaxID=33114 RepID=A0A2G2V8W1_CAPBA|nr:Eukaryotic initiation factor 4A-3 [Capsicum baccatum]